MNNTEVEKSMQEFQYHFKEESIKNNIDFIEYKPVAIGYLNIEEEYSQGPVSQIFIDKLQDIWDTGVTASSMGHHICELCEEEDKATSSSEKTLKDGINKIEYKFPQMIFHYIKDHNYQPPKEFIHFVLGLNVEDLRISSNCNFREYGRKYTCPFCRTNSLIVKIKGRAIREYSLWLCTNCVTRMKEKDLQKINVEEFRDAREIIDANKILCDICGGTGLDGRSYPAQQCDRCVSGYIDGDENPFHDFDLTFREFEE